MIRRSRIRNIIIDDIYLYRDDDGGGGGGGGNAC